MRDSLLTLTVSGDDAVEISGDDVKEVSNDNNVSAKKEVSGAAVISNSRAWDRVGNRKV